MSHKSSSVDACIADSRHDQASFSRTQGAVRHKIDGPLEKALKKLVDGKETVIGFHSRGEFQINVHIAFRIGLVFGERTEDANPPHTEGAQLGGMSFHQSPWVYIAGH